MATNFYNFKEHAIAESTKLGATHGAAHIYNVEAKADTDNGTLVNLDDMEYLRPEVYSQVDPTATSKVGLVLTDPLIYEETPYKAQDPANFYNEKGDIMRVYELIEGDIFTVSAKAIAAVKTAPEVGNYVVANKGAIKEVAKASAPEATVAFVGKIVGTVTRSNGVFYKINVIRNA